MAPSGTTNFVSMEAVNVVMVVESVLVVVRADVSVDLDKALSLIVNNRPQLNTKASTYVSLVETTSVDAPSIVCIGVV